MSFAGPFSILTMLAPDRQNRLFHPLGRVSPGLARLAASALLALAGQRLRLQIPPTGSLRSHAQARPTVARAHFSKRDHLDIQLARVGRANLFCLASSPLSGTPRSRYSVAPAETPSRQGSSVGFFGCYHRDARWLEPHASRPSEPEATSACVKPMDPSLGAKPSVGPTLFRSAHFLTH